MLSPRAALFPNVPIEVVTKVLQCAYQWFGRPRRQCAKGIAGVPHFCLREQAIEIAGAPASLFQRAQRLFDPPQAAPAGSAPATRFAREEAHHIPDHTYRTGMVVE